MIPLLIRGLRERATAVKRKSALIIDNMAKVRAPGHGLQEPGPRQACGSMFTVAMILCSALQASLVLTCSAPPQTLHFGLIMCSQLEPSSR